MLKHIGIPTLDISGRTDWQSLVDREKNQYLGHVTTAMTADRKTVYAVYPKCHALGQIVLKRSDDGGRSWSASILQTFSKTIFWATKGRGAWSSGSYSCRRA